MELSRASVWLIVVLLLCVNASLSPLAYAVERLPLTVRKALAMEDYESAISWLEPAAEDGDPEAAYALGKLYRLGIGVQQNSQLARKYFEAAARGEIVDAQYLLARDHERDGSVDVAGEWYELAAKNNHQQAIARLLELADAPLKQDIFHMIRSKSSGSFHVTATDVRARDSSGETPLITAVRAGSEDWVSTLLDSGSDVSVWDNTRNTALHYAAQQSDSVIVALLLSKGAKVSVVNERQLTPLHLAVGADNLLAVAALLDAGASPVRADAEGWTPLMIAQRQSDPRLLKLLGQSTALAAPQLFSSQRRLEVLDANQGLTHAVRTGNLSMLREALDLGAGLEPTVGGGAMVLHLAVALEKLPVVRELLRVGADSNAQNQDGETPAMLAAATGNSAVFKAVLESGADLKILDVRGRSVLHHSVQGECQQCVELLLNAGVDVDVLDSEGLSALLMASRKSGSKLGALMAQGTTSPDVSGNDGRTALWWAVKFGRKALVEQLLRSGALLIADDNGIHPLHLAARSDDEIMTRLLATQSAGLVGVTTAQGNTPLMLAAHRDAVRVVEALIELGAEIDGVNRLGDTPLLMAVKSRSLQSARLLIQKGASTNRRNLQRESARSLVERRGDGAWQELIDTAPSEFELLLGRVSGL